MHTMFQDKPLMATIVKAGVILFICLSVANLYYSIKVNRTILKEKQNA